MKAMKAMKKKSSLPRTFRIFTAAAMILAAGVPSTSAYASGGRKAEAPAPLVMPPSGSVPVIDGRLDDAIWSSASRFDAFKTFKPDYGKEPSQRTEAYLAYDPDNVYFAFRCEDTEPAKIKSSVCKRDAMGQDDMVGLILDTFNDNQSGFTFMLNPLGIQGDGIMDVQGNVDDSHDMVWYSKGLIDDGGWTVEARVPLQSLRFPDREVPDDEMPVLPVPDPDLGAVRAFRPSTRTTATSWPRPSPSRSRGSTTNGSSSSCRRSRTAPGTRPAAASSGGPRRTATSA